MIEDNFEKTSSLWGKYNAVTGGNDAIDEHEIPEMLGWTEGVYIELYAFSNDTKAEV